MNDCNIARATLDTNSENIHLKVCRYHYFVLSGMLRKFFVNEEGIEQPTESAMKPGGLRTTSPKLANGTH